MQDKRIGQYKVTDQVLGSGTFSTVYSAFSNKNKKLAVKIIPRHNIKENDIIYFQREINLLKNCKNQWIVNFVDIKKSKTNFYIFQQYCDGGSLAQYITRDKRLPQLQALRIFSQIVRGMSCMKGMNIIHRDLKPANIMLKNGNVKIVDFGLARKFYHGDLLKTIVGSPLNMAPQVLKGQAYTDKVDIYSAGTILYQMLYGICPFEARNRQLLVKQIDKRKFKKSQQEIQISQKVINALKWMLQPQPSKRMDITQLLDFVQTFQKQQRDKKLNQYYKISKRSQPYYGVFSSVAAPFIYGCKKASPKQPLNLDLKMCSKLINQIQN